MELHKQTLTTPARTTQSIESCGHLQAESPGKDSWIIISSNLFAPNPVCDGSVLAQAILSAGGKILIAKEAAHPFAYPEHVSRADQIEASLNKLKAIADPGTLKIAELLPHTANHWPWMRDYLGIFTTTASGEINHHPSFSTYKPDGRAFGAKMQELNLANSSLLGLEFEGGSLIPLGSDTVVITKGFRNLNADQDDASLRATFAKIGRPNFIVVPDVEQQLYHADFIVNQIENKIYVAQISDLALELAKQNPSFVKIATALDESANIISRSGFDVERLPMPLPIYSQDTQRYCLASSVNMLQIRGDDNKLRVLLPWPTEQNLASMADSSLVGDYQQSIKNILLANAAVSTVEFVSVDTNVGGGLRCLASVAPQNLAQKLA